MNKLHMTVYGSRGFIPTAKYLHSLSLPLSFRVPKGGGGGSGRSPGALYPFGTLTFSFA